ncbi:MAG: hypothetical protein ACOZBW_12885 [Thermodesulfobacteriota bacterium]
MKQYVIDELRPGEYEKIRSFLDETVGPSAMEGIYWIPVPLELLSENQRRHADCRPHCFVVDLEETRISCELLVRTPNTVRCDCMAYATAGQREWLMTHIDSIFERLGIIT